MVEDSSGVTVASPLAGRGVGVPPRYAGLATPSHRWSSRVETTLQVGAFISPVGFSVGPGGVGGKVGGAQIIPYH